MVEHLPLLYGLDSKGRTKVWQISVTNENSNPEIVTNHGLEGGTLQEARVNVRVGKNIGKANETTAWEQATGEAWSKWDKKQLGGKYTPDPKRLGNETTVPKAMLAHPFEKRKKHMEFPAFIQPKLDGIRLLAHVMADKVMYHSRNGKVIQTVNHLDEFIMGSFPVGTVLDGELFNPEMTLQDIVSGAKKQSEKSLRLQYWIYDRPEVGKTFQERTEALTNDFLGMAKEESPLVLVYTTVVPNEESMKASHNLFVANGFEGTIIRHPKGEYAFGHRSNALLKYKEFQDDEFEIIGGRDGVGKHEGCVVFRCLTHNGKEFEAVPRGTQEQRAEWFMELPMLIGRQLTVRFFDYTPDGIPFHPVGIAIRDYE